MTWMGTAIRAAVGAAWSQRWTYAVPVATLLLPATLYAVRQPDVFRARAVVFARPLEGRHQGFEKRFVQFDFNGGRASLLNGHGDFDASPRDSALDERTHPRLGRRQ